MASVHFVYPGPPEQRVSAKVTAMQTLASVWSEAAGKFKPALDPGSVSLGLKEGNKPMKAVDVSTPWRLANIPAGSSLHITACRPAVAAAPAAPSQQPTAPAPPRPAPAPSGPGSSSRPVPTASGGVVSPLPSARGSDQAAPEVVGPLGAAGQAPASAPVVQSAVPQEQGSAQQQSGVSVAVQQIPQRPAAASTSQAPSTAPPTAPPAPAAAVSAPTQAHTQVPAGSEPFLLPASAGLGRSAVLVTEAALRAAAEAVSSPRPAQDAGCSGGEASGSAQGEGTGVGPMAVDDEDDSFYDLTPEDLAALARAAEAKRKEEAAGLKTKAMREAEERAKEESFSSVAVRVRLPDGVVLQAGFSGSEHLSALQELVSKVVVPGTKFHLFTTPPKQVLKDLTLSFYKAGLVPAANVHCGVASGTAGGGSLLRPELLPCILTSIPPGHLLPGQHSVTKPSGSLQAGRLEGGGEGAGGNRAGSGSQPGAGGSSRAAGAPRPANAEGDKKVPKWLKLK